jgi:hypothetical protein
LAFIDAYTKIHGIPAAEGDMQRYFRVTPPVVHHMVLTLERRGLLTRVPGQPRSIRLLVPDDEIPKLDGGKSHDAESQPGQLRGRRLR